MIARSMIEGIARISRSTSARTSLGGSALFARFRSFSLGTRVDVQIEPKFRKSLERYGKEEAVFFYARVIAYYSPERGHPGREITVNRITLFLEEAGRGFILFLNSKAPIIVEATITTNNKQTAILEKRIAIQITIRNVQLHIGQRLDRRDRIDFSKPLIESWYL